MKKPILIVLLFFLAAPVAYAYDFGAAGVVAALGVAGAGLALVFGAPAALGTVAIGALVAGVTFPVDHSSTQSSDVEVQLSPSAKLSTPVGWTAPASGQVEPSPPSSTAVTIKYQVGSDSGAANADPLTACINSLSPSYGPDAWSVKLSGSAYNCLQYGSLLRAMAYPVSSCPSGYSVSGNSCVLSDASIVSKPSDGRCTIKRSGNSFSVDPRDPDCASGKIPATTAISPNFISSTKADGSSKSVSINTDGSSTISESRPNTSNNTTETNTTTLSAPDAAGASHVTGQGSGVAPGTGTQAGSSTAPVNVNFDKSGLATEGTLGGIKSSVDAIKDGLDPGSSDSSLSAQKSAFDSAMDGLTAMFSAEPSKAATGLDNDFSLGGYLPSQCGCTPLTVTFHGHTASYDWCAPMAIFRDVLSWVLGMLTAVYVLSLFRIGGSK